MRIITANVRNHGNIPPKWDAQALTRKIAVPLARRSARAIFYHKVMHYKYKTQALLSGPADNAVPGRAVADL